MRKLLLLFLCAVAPAWGDLVVIGHPGLPQMDIQTVRRIYTGRVVQVGESHLTPLNLPAGSGMRNRFLQDYLGQDEGSYTGYWTVRRYVGKGVPPRELETTAEILRFVESVSGAIGYVDDSEVTPGATILLRR